METIIQYQTTEFVLPSLWSSDTSVSLTLPSGRILHLIAFQKKSGELYVRFSSPETGVVILSLGASKRKINVKKYQGTNPLFIHGPIVCFAGKKYLTHSDGTPFFYLADTWWYAMTGRTAFKDFILLLQDRKHKGFTVVQCIVGGTPEVPLFSPEAANEGGLPFTDDYQINPAYFDAVDTKI